MRKRKLFRRLKNRKLNRSAPGNFFVLLFLVLLGLFSVIPLYYTVIQALKPFTEIYIFPPKFYVSNPTLDNLKVLGDLLSTSWVPMSRYLFNSLFVCVVSIFLHVLVSSAAAFAFAKFEFPGSKLCFKLIVASLLFSPVVVALPRYIVMSWMGMIDTYAAMIAPWVASSLGLFLMKQNMEGINYSIIESAYLDGASDYRVFWTIAMPAMRPVTFTLIILAFQSIWNEQGAQYILSEKLKVFQAAISQIQTAGIARVGAGAAAAVILMIPPILIFLVSQSNVIETMTNSGMKD